MLLPEPLRELDLMTQKVSSHQFAVANLLLCRNFQAHLADKIGVYNVLWFARPQAAKLRR